MRIILSESGGDLIDQIRDQIRGLITAGSLRAEQRLPSVRQLAGDLRIAPGTVAKAYRALEAEGFLVTRVGSGTRVSGSAVPADHGILSAAEAFAKVSARNKLDVDEAVRILRAVWPTDGHS